VSTDELKGTRTTYVKVIATGENVTIKDTIEENKTLQDRWTGETHFELKEVIQRPAKVRRSVPKSKRKAEEDPPRDGGSDELQPGQPEQVPTATGSTPSLTQTLRRKGPDQLDGLPTQSSASAGSNICAAPECILPGGRRGHHQDSRGRLFMYDNYEGRSAPAEGEKPQDDDDSSSSDARSTSSASEAADSEELIRDGGLPEADDHPAEAPPQDTFLPWLAKCHSKKKGYGCQRRSQRKGENLAGTA
jgi:hypothetical protein